MAVPWAVRRVCLLVDCLVSQMEHEMVSSLVDLWVVRWDGSSAVCSVFQLAVLMVCSWADRSVSLTEREMVSLMVY